jgi:hypothetical protein
MIETLEYLSKYKSCPTCGAAVVNVVKDVNSAKDGSHYEHIKFECGCAVRYIPVQHIIKTSPCPESSESLLINARRETVVDDLAALIQKFEGKVDTPFLDAVLKHARNTADKYIERCMAIPKSEVKAPCK